MEQLRVIPLALHGLLSYALGVALVLLALAPGIDDGSSESVASIVSGVLVLALTLVGPTPVAAARMVSAGVIEGVLYVIALWLMLYPIVFDLGDERSILVTYLLLGIGYFLLTLAAAWPRKLRSPTAPSMPSATPALTAPSTPRSAPEPSSTPAPSAPPHEEDETP